MASHSWWSPSKEAIFWAFWSGKSLKPLRDVQARETPFSSLRICVVFEIQAGGCFEKHQQSLFY
jgi:hypothetical protein